MPATLSCTISKVATIPNKVNADIIAVYQKYMCDNGASECHQNNALKGPIFYVVDEPFLQVLQVSIICGFSSESFIESNDLVITVPRSVYYHTENIHEYLVS